MNNNQKQIAPLQTITASTLMNTEFDPLSLDIENTIPSGYGKKNIISLLGVNNSNLLYTKNNESLDNLLSKRLQLPQAVSDDTLINYNLSQATRNVNISPELDTTLKSLANGNIVENDMLDAVPEIANARKIASLVEETNHINTPERLILRHNILDTLTNKGSASIKNIDGKTKVEYNGAIEQGRNADIVIGLPAAGKSSVLADPLSMQNKARIIDSDMAKEMIPEFNNGYGAGAVHEESKGIIDTLLINSIENGDNIVYPIVGSNIKKVIAVIDNLKENGYTVSVHLNELPNEKALGRALQRFLDTGRFIDPKIIAAYGNKPTQIYEQLKNMEGYLDGYSKYSNDVPFGRTPRQIEVRKISRAAESDVRRPERLGQDSRGAGTPKSGQASHGATEVKEVKGNKYTKERGYSETIRTKNTVLPDEVKHSFIDNPEIYRVLSNKETTKKADDIVNSGGDLYAKFSDLLRKQDPAAIPLSNELAKMYIEQGTPELASCRLPTNY